MMKFGLALVVCSAVSSAKKSFFKEECKTDKLFNQWILDCFEDRDCKRCSSYFSNNATVMENVYNWCNTFEDTTCSSLKASNGTSNTNATQMETVSTTMMYVPLYKSKPHSKVHSPLVNSKAVRDNTAVYFGSLWALSKECCQDLHAVTRKLSPKHEENAASDHHRHHVENGEEEEEGGPPNPSSSDADFYQHHDKPHHEKHEHHHHEKHDHHHHLSNTTTATPVESSIVVSNPAAMIVAELVDGVLLSNTSGGSAGSSSSMGGLEHDLDNTVLDLFAGGTKNDERQLSKTKKQDNKNNRMFPPHCRMEKETFAVVVESAVDEKNPEGGQDVTTVFHELELFKKRKHMKKHSSSRDGRPSSDEDESSSVDSTDDEEDDDDDVSVVMKKGWNLMASGNCSELEQLVDTKPVEVSQIIPMGYPFLSGSGLSGSSSNVSSEEHDNSALNNFVSAMYALFPEDVRNTTLTVPMNSIAKYVCLMANATRQVEHARNIHISNMLVSTTSSRGISIVHFNDIKNQTVKSVISLVEYDPLSKKITKWLNYPAYHEVHDAEYAKASLLSAFADPYDFSGEDNADIESASSAAANSSSMLVRAVLSVSGLLATVCMLWAWNIRNTKNSLASVRALQQQQPAYEALLP